MESKLSSFSDGLKLNENHFYVNTYISPLTLTFFVIFLRINDLITNHVEQKSVISSLESLL